MQAAISSTLGKRKAVITFDDDAKIKKAAGTTTTRQTDNIKMVKMVTTTRITSKQCTDFIRGLDRQQLSELESQVCKLKHLKQVKEWLDEEKDKAIRCLMKKTKILDKKRNFDLYVISLKPGKKYRKAYEICREDLNFSQTGVTWTLSSS